MTQRLKLDLEAVDEDASNEVLQFEIQISLIYSKLVGLYIIGSYHHILSPTISEFLSEFLTWEDYLKESPHTGLVIEPQQCSLPCYLQQQLYTLVKEKFLSMLGSWICPIERTPVIIQVASQLLPRVTPEKIHKEVSHCLGLDQDTHSYTLERLRMVQLPIPVIHLWLALFFNLLPRLVVLILDSWRHRSKRLQWPPGHICFLPAAPSPPTQCGMPMPNPAAPSTPFLLLELIRIWIVVFLRVIMDQELCYGFMLGIMGHDGI